MPHHSAPMVFLVSTPRGCEQAFATRQDAESYAAELPDARVSGHVVWSSLDDAMVVVERRVIVADGRVRSDRTALVRQFVEDPFYRPDASDVESFRDVTSLDWHIVGFGTDRAELDATMQVAIAEAVAVSSTRTATPC